MKKIAIFGLTATILLFALLFFTDTASAVPIGPDGTCTSTGDPCVSGYACLPDTPTTFKCQPGIAITPPAGKGFADLGGFVGNVLVLVFGLGILIVLVMLIWGAFEWITSGGDKEAVGKARNRIINALIGMAVLAIAFALATVASQFTGIDIRKIVIPTPGP